MKKTDCESMQNVIPLYIDNMLSEEETDIVREHIATCPACRKELDFMQKILQETKGLPQIEVSEDFHGKVMEKIKEEAGGKKAFAFPWKTAAGLVAAAAVIAFSVVSYQNLNRDTAQPNPDAYMKTTEAPEPADAAEKAEEIKTSPDETATDVKQPASEDGAAKTSAKEEQKAPATERTEQKKTSPSASARNQEQTSSASAEKVQRETTPADQTKSDAPAPTAEQAPEHISHIPAPAAETASTRAELHQEEQAEHVPAVASLEEDLPPAAYTGRTERIGMNEPTDSANEKPSSGGGASASVGVIVTVSVAEAARPQALEILSAYETNATGYQVDAHCQTVLNRLSALEDFTMSIASAKDMEGSIIVLK